jgi:hypothetical protein
VLYETFLTRLKEASVQDSAYEADSRSSPRRWARSDRPPAARALMLSLILGLAVGPAWCWDGSTSRTPSHLEDLERHVGRPVLGQIPQMPVRARADAIRYLRTKPTSAAAESVRNLRTSVCCRTWTARRRS